MARDIDLQHQGGHFGFNLKEDAGNLAFSGTDSTLVVTTTLRKIMAWQFDVESVVAGVVEQITISSPSISDFSYIVPTNNGITTGVITLTRAAQPIRLEGSAGDGAIANDDVLAAPVGICPVAGSVTDLWWYNTVLSGGSPLINVGKVGSGGADAPDNEWFVDAADNDSSSHVPPASLDGKNIYALTDVGTYAGASRVVAANDLITLGTEGGTGSPSPTGIFLSMEVTPTLTSGLRFSYRFLGL